MKKSVKWLLARGAAGLFLDPGLGKTAITYAATKVLKNEGLLDGVLVVGPRRPIVETWPEEQEIWLEFNELKVVLLHGPKKEERALEKADVYLVTYDGFKWLAQSGHLARMLKKRLINVLVWDELSKMKHPKSGRSKVAKKWLHRFERRWGLTGSAAANGLMNLFGEMYALDMGKALGPYITHFRIQFFNPVAAYTGDPFPAWVPKEGAQELIYERIKDVALRIDGEDHLTLPKVIPHPMRFDLPAEYRAMYDSLEEKMFFALPRGEVFTAKTAATVSQKCRQLTSGAIYEDMIDPLLGTPRTGKRRYEVIHTEKLQMLEDLIDELNGQQLLIAYEFVHEAERMLALLGKDTPIIGGGTSDKRANEYKRAWNEGSAQFLLGHPSSIALGINIQKSHAAHICWFSGTWDYEMYDQLNRRLKRQGNEASHIFLHTFIARHTVDESVYAAMSRKRGVQDKLYAALRR